MTICRGSPGPRVFARYGRDSPVPALVPQAPFSRLLLGVFLGTRPPVENTRDQTKSTTTPAEPEGEQGAKGVSRSGPEAIGASEAPKKQPSRRAMATGDLDDDKTRLVDAYACPPDPFLLSVAGRC
jgi:hypothetical protein